MPYPPSLVVLALTGAFEVHGILGRQSATRYCRSLISPVGQDIRRSQSHACTRNLDMASRKLFVGVLDRGGEVIATASIVAMLTRCKGVVGLVRG